MNDVPRYSSTKGGKARNVLCVLAGVAVLVLKKHYTGPGEQLVMDYGGNTAVSFALYFLFLRLPIQGVFGKQFAAVVALAVVELFEATDGFGLMTNTYDPIDFVANAAGVALALTADCIWHATVLHRKTPDQPG